jgi:hypothetical protein
LQTRLEALAPAASRAGEEVGVQALDPPHRDVDVELAPAQLARTRVRWKQKSP